MENKTLTALSGVKVGHSTHIDKLTGCTVILFDKPYSVAYKAYGGAIGSFNFTDKNTINDKMFLDTKLWRL
jgi:L-aminopeptidase/D-esterase-like protein